MGYYVTMTDACLRIRKDDHVAAYEALCRLNWRNDLKHGGSWPRTDADGPHPDVWFSWLHWNYHETCHNLESILVHVGFETWVDNVGTLQIEGYNDKAGCEDVFLEALAPFYDRTDIEPYAEWRGEDGEEWRDTFTTTHLEHQRAVRTWDGATLQSYRVN